MPRDGGGTYTLPAGNPVIPGTIIDTTWANPTMNDIAAALTDSLSRTGSGGMIVPFLNADGTVNLPGISWANQQNMGFYRPSLDEMRVSVAANDKARWTSSATDPYELFIAAAWVPVMHESGDYTPTGNWDFSGAASFDYFAPIFLGEQAAANVSVAAFGQFWVRDDVPNIPMFTDDAGTDFPFVIAVPTISGSTLRGAGGTYVEERTVHILAAGGGIQIFDSTEINSLVIAHDGVDVNFFGFGTTVDWNIGSLTGRVNIDAGLSVTTELEIFNAAKTESVSMEINSTTMAPAPAFVFIESAAIEVYSFNEPINIDNGSIHIGGNNRGIEFWRYGDSVSHSIVGDAGGIFAQVIAGVFRMQADSLQMDEVAASAGDVAGRGQFWVRNDSPNTPMFTDDVGTDFDLSAGSAGAFRGCKAYYTGTFAYPRNDAPGFASEALTPFNAEVFDTDAIHNIAVTNSRFVVPAGVTRIRIEAGVTFALHNAGGLHFRIRRNGITNLDADPGQVGGSEFHTTHASFGSGQNVGYAIDTGVMSCIAGDYYELMGLWQAGGPFSSLAGEAWLSFEVLQ